MKIASVLILTIVSLCASICCPGEEDYNYSYTEIENNNLIQVADNQTVFNVDETLYISTNIPNEQIRTTGETVLLTDYITLNTVDNFYYFNIYLYKETAYGTFALIELSVDALEVIEGQATIDNQSLFIQNNFNNNAFNSNFGIQLIESGRYYLAGNANNYYSDSETIRISANNYGNNSVTIFSNIINSNTEGRYYFTVE